MDWVWDIDKSINWSGYFEQPMWYHAPVTVTLSTTSVLLPSEEEVIVVTSQKLLSPSKITTIITKKNKVFLWIERNTSIILHTTFNSPCTTVAKLSATDTVRMCTVVLLLPVLVPSKWKHCGGRASVERSVSLRFHF